VWKSLFSGWRPRDSMKPVGLSGACPAKSRNRSVLPALPVRAVALTQPRRWYTRPRPDHSRRVPKAGPLPRQIRARAIGKTVYQLRARHHRWCHEHAKRRPFLAPDFIRVGPYLGTPLARQHAQPVQLCHFMRGDVRHHGFCCVRCKSYAARPFAGIASPSARCSV
jgi:hypothetical protein